ncbi:laminin subunit alpha-3-like isoform X3 [Apostichopus japonicus]
MEIYNMRYWPGGARVGIPSLAMPKMKFALLAIIIVIVFPSLLYSQDFLIEQECERTYANGTKEYLACMGTAEHLFLLQVNPQVEPESSTCGLEDILDRSIYCTLDFNFRCSICNTSNETLAHPPEYVYDQEPSLADGTWWQSISWYDYPIPLEVNLTLSLNHTYKLNSDIVITFQSGRPQSMVLEKSLDNGQSWDVYQYFAQDCSVFSMSASTVRQLNDPTEVICTEGYSNPLPHSGGIVEFDVSSRYSLLSASRSPEVIIQAMENNTEFLRFLSITDLRIRLLYPATDGLEHSGQILNLVKYYYAISDFGVFLICDCNLHSAFCTEADDGISCDCQHNTMGMNCEQCLPLYNNRPWQKGSLVPYPTGSANECQKCTCYGHATSCTYNATVGYGVCDDCKDNTAGVFCHLCTEGFYPNMSVAIDDVDRCVDCACDVIGSVENSTACNQLTVDGDPVGQCPCKTNVTGRSCDRCVDGYYGLSSGVCQACQCDVQGTINGSFSCDQENGNCLCKSTVTGQTCDQCKDEYFQFPADDEAECRPCGCEPGQSRSLICQKESGNCECRNNLLGIQCLSVQPNYFVPQLDFINFDAWPTLSSCQPKTDPSRNDVSGQGYLSCSSDDVIYFNNITIATSSDVSRSYRPVVRYSYDGSAPSRTVSLTFLVSHNASGLSNNTLCEYDAGEVIYQVYDVTFEPGSGEAWFASNNQTLSLEASCVYQAQLNLTSPLSVETVDVDSLLVLPVPNNFTVFQRADVEEQLSFETCQKNAASLTTRELINTETCSRFGASLMAELFDGAIPCGCDTTGSILEYCDQGGQCLCKAAVGGRRCDYCLPGYYNFGPEGCVACNCSESFAVNGACDYITGQCMCKEGVAENGESNTLNLESDLQCRSCLVNYYPMDNLQGCAPCNCSLQGSTDMQCDDFGVCSCKETIAGEKCDQCQPGFYQFTSDGCLPCDCNPSGSTSEVCHPEDGSCACKANVIGTKCDQCAAGTFNLQMLNVKGCQECFCFNHSSGCSAALNYIKAAISSDFRMSSLDGWSSSDPTSVDVNPGNIRVSHPPSLPESQFIYLSSPQKFLGSQLSSYGLSITINMKLEIGTVSRSNAPLLKVAGGRGSQVILFSGEDLIPTSDATSFTVHFYEDLWSVQGEQRSPSSSELHDILSNIVSIEVRGSFGIDTVTTFYFITMETAEKQAALRLGDSPIFSVEQCVCASNTTGLSCEVCDPGTFRSNFTGNPYDGCTPCECQDRAQTCDADTGTCLDCRPGTIGDHCELCASNVQGPDCLRCEPNHYGFGTDLFNGGCAACACNISGTANEETQCDNQDGQCPCQSNYGGRQCADCSLNYYNYEAGCLRCDACYDSVLDLFQMRSSEVLTLESQVGSLQASDLSSGSFSSRYEHANEQFLLLVAETNSVEERLTTFDVSVFDLNRTMSLIMDQLEMSRDVLEAISINQTTAEGHVAMSEDAIANITLYLQSAYSALFNGDFEAVANDLRDLATDLSIWEDQLKVTSEAATRDVILLNRQIDEIRNVTEKAVTASSMALQTVLAAHAVHDNVTSQLASILAEASSTGLQIETYQQEADELLQRATSTLLAVETTVTSVSQQDLTSLENRLTNIRTSLSETATSANDLSQQVDNQLDSLESITKDVAGSINVTHTLADASNSLINDIEELVSRTETANRRAKTALTSSNQVFAVAEEQLDVVRNFQNVSSVAQAQASAVSNNVGMISIEAGNAYSLAVQQRAELLAASSDVSTGLGNSAEANRIVEDHNTDILRLQLETRGLQEEYQISFNESDDKIARVERINETTLQVIRQQCLSHQRDIQSLESMATATTNLAQEAAEDSLKVLEEINKLTQELNNIDQLELGQLDALRSRVSVVSAELTQAQYEEVSRLLKAAVDEQDTWITNTSSEIEMMRNQINALESFRVN